MTTTAPQTLTQWAIDNAHSQVQFKVKHLVISTVTGEFKEFAATVASNGNDFGGAQVRFTAQVASIHTGQSQRDEHLRSADFFDAANHPELSFVGKRLTKKSDDQYELVGDLTIRGTTKEVTLAVEFGGVVVDPYGQTKAGFELTGKINRKDYGLNWSAVTEAGGVVVSDEVKLLAHIQLVQQA